MGIQIYLNSLERVLVEYVAAERVKYNRENQIINQRVMKGNQLKIETDSFGAELAFCRLFNLYPDFQIGNHADYDVTLPNGLNCDIKQTTRPDGQLLVMKNKETHPANVYALVLGAFPHYEYIGYALRDDVFTQERLTDLGYGAVYAIPQQDLHRGAEMFEILISV